jgi:hypothetical protein
MHAVILSIAIPVAVAFAAWVYELASDYTKVPHPMSGKASTAKTGG